MMMMIYFITSYLTYLINRSKIKLDLSNNKKLQVIYSVLKQTVYWKGSELWF